MQTSNANRQRGFTLIELMIGVSVAGILSSIALPSFESQLQKSRRSDVLVATMAVQSAQERFRSNSMAYGSLAEIGVPSASPAKHYTLQITANDAEGFELLATATGTQSRDVGCRYMKLTSTGMNLVYRSGPDASVTNDAAASQKCWSL
ncbi:MAG: type IV pilin protein [Burkholderiales bacterium]